MKKRFLLLFLATVTFADIKNINSFEADFQQKITNDENKTIVYFGHIKAKKPSYAIWKYTKPIKKSVYIIKNRAVIVEPELEQAIIKRIDNNFNFFKLIKDAKQISKEEYLAKYNDIPFLIKTDKEKIVSISYKDEFENQIIITFQNQTKGKKIKNEEFNLSIPKEYDIIKDQ